MDFQDQETILSDRDFRLSKVALTQIWFIHLLLWVAHLQESNFPLRIFQLVEARLDNHHNPRDYQTKIVLDIFEVPKLRNDFQILRKSCTIYSKEL